MPNDSVESGETRPPDFAKADTFARVLPSRSAKTRFLSVKAMLTSIISRHFTREYLPATLNKIINLKSAQP